MLDTQAISSTSDTRVQGTTGTAPVVLAVDDEPDILELATELLSGWGYRVLTAPGGAEALALLARTRRVDLLFTDLVMPGPVNGVELAERALELRPDLKVLFTSGYARHPVLPAMSQRRAGAFIAKPYRPAELSRQIRALLGD
jgi:CheY-like chemotaxis protein